MAKIKIPLVILVLVLVLGSLNYTEPVMPVNAAPDAVEWLGVDIPVEGRPGNWVLADGSDVRHLTMAADGTLYGYAAPSGTGFTLFRSTDDGRSWSYTGGVQDAIVDIATSPDDAGIVYYATASDVYKSTDAGNSFTQLPANPGGAGSNNVEITSIAVAPGGGGSLIAVGTRDTDAAEYGGVYVPGEPFTGWADTNIGNCDVYAVAFASGSPADRELVAVVTDEVDTFITAKVGDDGWGATLGDAAIAGLEPVSAAIAFPADYDVDDAGCALFAAIDTGSNDGDVYRVSRVQLPGGSVATDLDVGSAYGLTGVDVTGLAVSGGTAAANLLAGAASGAQVYFSTDGGTNWTKNTKEPTGTSEVDLVMAPDFASSGRAYAATVGVESAFSCTADGGVTWNQVSLIDTEVSSIVDLAVSPGHNRDDTLFMLTSNGEHSLWRSLNDGVAWERVFSSALTGVDSFDMVELSPQCGSGGQVVFLAGVSGGNPVVWQSTDDGQTFTPRVAPLAVDVWAVADDDTLFIGGYDAVNGLVYRTDDSGATYSAGAVAGDQQLSSIVLSPELGGDGVVLAGNTTGQVYWSDDNGASFTQLGQQLPLSAGLGEVTIVFDPGFGSSGTVYAASDAEATAGDKQRIYRFVIDRSDAWESIDGTLPDGAIIEHLGVSADGVLYAANSQLVDVAEEEGGMERCLNPAYPLNPAFETVTRGLDDGAVMTGLWLCGNQLWSIDTANIRLRTYIDTLSVPVVLVSPSDEAPGVDTAGVSLDWVVKVGANRYQWQLDYDADFSAVPSGFEGETQASSTWIPALEPATEYYWRVRVTEPVLSPWSDKWSFTTVLGNTVVAPELLSPGAGASGVPLKPVFQWSAIAGADSYELLVSPDFSFNIPVIMKVDSNALPATAWQSDVNLNYDTTYYWKVRGGSSDSYSAWSAVGAFTTGSAPPEEPPPEDSTPEESAPEPPPSLESSSFVPSLSGASPPGLLSPGAGSGGVPLRPVLQWSAVAGAESYELLVSADFSFTDPLIVKVGAYALPATAWQSDVTLDYDTTYYWKVRGCLSGDYSPWSAVGAFTTEEASETPETPVQPTVPHWVIYLGVGLSVAAVLLLIALLVLRVRRF
jgi:hypothetical protein